MYSPQCGSLCPTLCVACENLSVQPRSSWRDDAETDYAESSPEPSPQLLVRSRRGSEALQWHDQLRQTEEGRAALRRFSELNCGMMLFIERALLKPCFTELNALQNQWLSAETKQQRKALRQQVCAIQCQGASSGCEGSWLLTVVRVGAAAGFTDCRGTRVSEGITAQTHMPRSTLLLQDSRKLPASADKESTPLSSTPPSSTPPSAAVSPPQETEQQLQQQSRRQHPRRTFGCPPNDRPVRALPLV